MPPKQGGEVHEAKLHRAPLRNTDPDRISSLVNLSLYCQRLHHGVDSLLLFTELYITSLMRITWDENIFASPHKNPQLVDMKLSGSMSHRVSILELTGKHATIETLLTLSTTQTHFFPQEWGVIKCVCKSNVMKPNSCIKHNVVPLMPPHDLIQDD